MTEEAHKQEHQYRHLTPSLPPEKAEQVQDVMREESRTMSELIREIL